jgi:cytochrome c-type biogenesis protein CcmH/NrfG
MKRDSLVFAVSGMFFGLIVGWIIGTQQAGPLRPAAQQAPTQVSTPQPVQSGQPPAVLDEVRVRALEAAAQARADDAAVRVELGNMYYDANRFPEAIRWYEEAVAIDPKNVSASTDLAVAYYYTDQVDRSLAQFAKSLEVDPKHAKTLLNLGIVRAFGKQDLEGAAAAWQQVIDLDPASAEGRAAKQALDNMRSAHPGTGTAPSGSGSPPPSGG